MTARPSWWAVLPTARSRSLPDYNPPPMPIDPLALAIKLIDVPSPTGSEVAVGELLESELASHGFVTRRQMVADGRFNLLALAGGRPRVILNSHIDTVPPWFGAREDPDFLYGRGACDTKGIIAAMIAASVKLRETGVGDFGLLLVVGEEGDSDGAKAANLAFADLGSEYVVVGEPTESLFARASKGALTCTVRFEGKAAHSAYPERGDSAVNRMVAAIAEINAHDWGSHEVLGSTSVNVGVVRGGEKPNIIAAAAECEIMYRHVSTPEEVLSQLEALVARHGGRITASRGNPPQFMKVPEGRDSVVVAFNTDVPWLSNLGEPLLFGPGSILDAHGVDERISKRELLGSIRIYEEMVLSLLEGRVS